MPFPIARKRLRNPQHGASSARGGGVAFSWRTSHSVTPPLKPRVSPPEIKIRRSCVGFRNLSGRSEKAWLSTAISSMLNTELSAGEQLRLVSEEDVARTKIEQPLADAPSLAKLVERLRVNLALTSSSGALHHATERTAGTRFAWTCGSRTQKPAKPSGGIRYWKRR